jgi:hypothetical protein
MGLESWKLVIDILLMTTVGLFTYKSLRTPNTFRHSKRLGELDASLRMLIREASSAGSTLNDELIIRKQELERLLQELELTASRLSQGRDGAFRILGDLREYEQKSCQIRTEIKELYASAQSLGERLEELCVAGEMAAPPAARAFEGAVRFASSKPARQRSDTANGSKPLANLIEREKTAPVEEVGSMLQGIESSSRRIITQTNALKEEVSDVTERKKERRSEGGPVFETHRY